MKRKDIELERREWLVKGDPKHVVYATLTWYPTDRVNGYPARYRVQLANVRREPSATGLVWEVGNPFEAWNWNVLDMPKGARRSSTWDDKARARFVAYVADFLGDYLERYGLRIDTAVPATCYR